MSKVQQKQYAGYAIVLGPKGVNTTGLIRSLGMAGIFVTFASTYGKVESRYTKDYLKLPNNTRLWLDALKAYCLTLPMKPVIFVGDDESAYFLDDNWRELSEIAIVSHANGRLRELSDKTVMAELAKNNGLLVPNYVKCSLEELLAQKVTLPVIIKPYAAYAGSKGDIRICHTEEDIKRAHGFLNSKSYEQVMVQELISEDNQFEIGLMGCVFPNGDVIIPGTIKKIRSYPINRGSTTYAQVVNGFCGVEIEKVKAFVRDTRYVGIFDIEMIIADNKPYYIEMNYRNGQYGFAPTSAGYNIPVNWYRGMNGQSVDPEQTLSEVFYMNERDDYLHVMNGYITKAQWKNEFRSATAFGMYCPGDQRPYVRQYVKVPDRITIKMKNIVNKFSGFFIREEWIIAIRPRSERLLFEAGGAERAFTIVPNSFRAWCADPFIITVGEKDYLFFEMFDRFKGRGVIGCRMIEPNGNIGKMKMIYETKRHLSFPFVFEVNGEFYMMPESSYDSNLTLLKAKQFPGSWEKVSEWFQGTKICDSVLFEKAGEKYLLTQPIEKPYTHAKLDLYKMKDDNWIPCFITPVINDASKARMAGAVVNHNGRLIRPAQDCKSYGDAITFHEILSVEGQYSELDGVRICPDGVKVMGSEIQYCGIHTYNLSRRHEVIDLKMQRQISWGYLFGVFYNYVHSFFK